jgi:hypothetical protein
MGRVKEIRRAPVCVGVRRNEAPPDTKRSSAMMQGILNRMDERQTGFIYTFAIVSLLNAYAIAQLMLM